MSPTQLLVFLHVGAGALWLLVSVAVAIRRAIGRSLLALQAAASSVTLLVGILLWHALHAGSMGPTEHMLVIGTFCAFVALGLQVGVAATGATGRLSASGFGVHATSVVFLAGAAAAMVASRLVS